MDLAHERLDGELGPIDAEALSQHLTSCAKCRQEDEQMRTILALETERPLDDPGPEFAAAVMSRLSEESCPVSFMRPLLVLAAMTAIILTVSHLWVSGFRYGDAADLAAGAWMWTGATLGSVWNVLASWSTSLTSALAQQGDTWPATVRSYLPVLAAIALVLLALAGMLSPKTAKSRA
ncbi:MAG TPA: zf-HC2 domain-containing protein [Planctomycetota bacterium]|jgi:anti-sigma factor RsiW